MRTSLLLLTLASTTAHAGFTVADLARDAKAAITFYDSPRDNNANTAMQAGLFAGFVAGVIDAAPGQVMCNSKPITAEEEAQVVSAYLAATPEAWGKEPHAVVWIAFPKAWPCPKQ